MNGAIIRTMQTDELKKLDFQIKHRTRTSGDMHHHNTYVDYSMVPDPDTLEPLTPIGRVPNFPAKLHAILCRKDLSDIICWLPHGRSWRILRPCQFEKIVLPKYFGHSKMSSFLRQASSWGFRRMLTGMSVDSYVHPLFLRGIPHLCKFMKRFPTEKARGCLLALKDLDLDQISKINPVPETYLDDSVLLPSILQHGPKGRIPVVSKWKPKISDFNFVAYSNGGKPHWVGTSAQDSSSVSSDSSLPTMDMQSYSGGVCQDVLIREKGTQLADDDANDKESTSMLDTLADVVETGK